MTPLENKITEETCLHRIKALKLTYVPRDYDKCINCQEPCENYIPVKRCQERYSYLNLYVK